MFLSSTNRAKQRKHMNILSSKPAWLALRFWRKVWVRVALFAVLALVTAASSQWLGRFIPPNLAERLGADSVDQILTILASTMLAVTTFSLSISVSAYASAAGTATPRATSLLQEDSTTQNVLATFLGAFVFSLVGIIALKCIFSERCPSILSYSAAHASQD